MLKDPTQPDSPPAPVLHAFGIGRHTLELIPAGLINRSWRATRADGTRCVVQRLNPIFAPDINRNIDAVTRHLSAGGLVTPMLIPTTGGALWVQHDGATWRALTMIDGITRDAVETPRQAREAGQLLGRFHRALADFDAPLCSSRPGGHDTRLHIAALHDALARHRDHPAHDTVRPLAEQALALTYTIPTLPVTPDRLVHGDPKISNIVFDETTGRALCMIDLDTLARMPIMLELGDAVRSWCNPGPEDAAAARFSLPLFEAAMDGYADGSAGLLTPVERDAVADAAITIALELTFRFCADALNERYFAWDPVRYHSASDHNRTRAENQFSLAHAMSIERDAMLTALARAFTAR